MEIQRDNYLNKLIYYKDNGRIKIVTGIRRCGKTYLLMILFVKYLKENGVKDDQIIQMSLDDDALYMYRTPIALRQYLDEVTSDSSKKYYVLLDEIQNVRDMDNPVDKDGDKLTFAGMLIGLMKRKNVDIYVTGSNSKMLSKDVLTQFRDRGDVIQVYPLSYEEVCSIIENKDEALRMYINFGGLPRVYELDMPLRQKYLQDLFTLTYLRDIQERNAVRNDAVLHTLLEFISSSVGSLTNPTKLANRFQSEKHISIKPDTIENYLTYFEDSFLISSAKRYDIKGSRYFTTPLKYYFTDIGLRNAVINFRQVETTHLMENIIYNELVRRGYSVDVGVVEKREEGKRVQLEVDFVVNRDFERVYIQSALNVDDPEKLAQERRSLINIDDKFQCVVIVYGDILPRRDEKGIYYIGLKEFLLNKNAL